MAAVEPSEREEDFEEPFYKPHEKVYPQNVAGTYRRIKWIVLLITLGIYYLTPFVRWDRGPDAPDQAVLIDLPARRFYFFMIEIWPQEIYYLAGLLILAALALFLMNAVAGRIWCGYLCPQTVWTDLFLAIERWTEGDRRERMRADERPMTVELALRKGGKHFLWLMTAWWTGGAWVLYFADAPSLVGSLATLQAPFIAYLWIGILTFTTYSLAGYMREQVCVYMCPWPRIQAALTDEDAMNVTYRFDRGEPRMSAKKSVTARKRGELAGDCVDCNQCVAVCPTGIDIRNGPDLGCIQCGLCIDACDNIMHKLKRTDRLIAYDTDINIIRRQNGEPQQLRIIRPRTILYAGMIIAISLMMVWGLATRSLLDVSVIHDRNPAFVVLSEGGIRNAYAVRILNKHNAARRFEISVEGLPGSTLEVFNAEVIDGRQVVEVMPDQSREFRATLTHDATEVEDSTVIRFVVHDRDDDTVATAQDTFRGPGVEQP
ncbi:MAG: cytochrome c oxidase accessory protein CcoG [Alphaproteobacteria bacterium]